MLGDRSSRQREAERDYMISNWWAARDTRSTCRHVRGASIDPKRIAARLRDIPTRTTRARTERERRCSAGGHSVWYAIGSAFIITLPFADSTANL